MIIALLFIFILLQTADSLTTVHILKNGGKEVNSALAYLFTKIGILQTLITLKGISVIALIALMQIANNTEVLFVLSILNLWYLGVVGWNSYQIFKK